MDKIKALTDILTRLNNGESIESVKEETKDLLEKISPTELSLAEQKLVEDGMKTEDLRGLCVIHMEMLKDTLEKLKASVDKKHPLYMMITEHDSILGFLQQLEQLNNKIQCMDKDSIVEENIKNLGVLAENLISAENHHLREEDALFPELERLGITGPTRIMRMEHQELRARKKNLLQLSEQFDSENLDEFKRQVDDNAKYLIFNLRDHIFKENHILYPSALESIENSEKWQEIKDKCDEIGYCPFSEV
ncbi:histidine kinase [Clostridium zeae]|uniref:Histidine kinase n=1 Tax=Clostridium zeae TaxID=2759022 RepID=A0ABQ1ECF9_9CLOT|nr:DUF438 domain-containing protein [Clostridium zeae]GFZ32193.1 histidine kinase [Clostridium zeae]